MTITIPVQMAIRVMLGVNPFLNQLFFKVCKYMLHRSIIQMYTGTCIKLGEKKVCAVLV